MSEEKPKTIFVASHPDTGERVGLWEIHPDHPSREVFVYGQETEPVEVALTPAVLEALAPQGDRGEEPPRLVRLEGPALEQRRSVAKLAAQRNATASISAATSEGRAVVTEVASARHAEEVSKLEKKLADLEAELQESKTKSADTLREQSAKDTEDNSTVAQLTREEREQANAAARNVPPPDVSTEERRRSTRSGRTGE